MAGVGLSLARLSVRLSEPVTVEGMIKLSLCTASGLAHLHMEIVGTQGVCLSKSSSVVYIQHMCDPGALKPVIMRCMHHLKDINISIWTIFLILRVQKKSKY